MHRDAEADHRVVEADRLRRRGGADERAAELGDGHDDQGGVDRLDLLRKGDALPGRQFDRHLCVLPSIN